MLPKISRESGNTYYHAAFIKVVIGKLELGFYDDELWSFKIDEDKPVVCQLGFRSTNSNLARHLNHLESDKSKRVPRVEFERIWGLVAKEYLRSFGIR